MGGEIFGMDFPKQVHYNDWEVAVNEMEKLATQGKILIDFTE